MGCLLGASCVASCVPQVIYVDASSLIFCCLRAIMSKRRVCAKDQNLSRRVFAILLSWMRAILLMSCVFWPFVFRLMAVEGWTLASVVAMLVVVSWRVVPACPTVIQTSELESAPISSCGTNKEGVGASRSFG